MHLFEKETEITSILYSALKEFHDRKQNFV